MSDINPEEKCVNCLYYSKEEECRKYAPRGKSKWAEVDKIDWCGEFKGKKPPPVGTI